MPTRGTDLLAECARGDQRAFARLYDMTSARVYGMVLRVVRDPVQAAEISHEAYLQIWREPTRFDPPREAVLPRLLTIAHRRTRMPSGCARCWPI